jgi:hypothetical protein
LGGPAPPVAGEEIAHQRRVGNLTCHEVLAAAAQPRAAEFLEHAHRLLSERAEPLGAAERATFLGNVPTNRAIVAAWERCGGVS